MENLKNIDDLRRCILWSYELYRSNHFWRDDSKREFDLEVFIIDCVTNAFAWLNYLKWSTWINFVEFVLVWYVHSCNQDFHYIILKSNQIAGTRSDIQNDHLLSYFSREIPCKHYYRKEDEEMRKEVMRIKQYIQACNW